MIGRYERLSPQRLSAGRASGERASPGLVFGIDRKAQPRKIKSPVHTHLLYPAAVYKTAQAYVAAVLMPVRHYIQQVGGPDGQRQFGNQLIG